MERVGGCPVGGGEEAGGCSDGHDYYEHWLAALESLLASKGLAAKADVDTMAQAWERAAHATPHGKPILLENDPGPPLISWRIGLSFSLRSFCA